MISPWKFKHHCGMKSWTPRHNPSGSGSSRETKPRQFIFLTKNWTFLFLLISLLCGVSHKVVRKKPLEAFGDVLKIENMSGGPEETPPARLLRDLSCVALCPAACWFRRGYLNRGPKSRLICHSAGRTGQLHRAAI